MIKIRYFLGRHNNVRYLWRVLYKMVLLLIFIALYRTIIFLSQTNRLKLEQVLILSRHHIRTPLAPDLKMFSSKVWPKFNESLGQLTQKGALLEGHFAEYIAGWLLGEDFITICPKQDEVLFYADTKSQRTIDTAKVFAEVAFPSCKIIIRHKENDFENKFDTIFHNNSDHFKEAMIKEMEKKLSKIDLTDAYLELNRILDLQNSVICKQDFLCDLNQLSNEIVYLEGISPDISGPLFIGTNVADAFVMSYYEGFPLEDVAWGEIRTDEQWKMLAKVLLYDQQVRFNFQPGSEDITRPLLKYMFGIFESGIPKLTVIVGHESNINLVAYVLGGKEFAIKDEYEPYPIGGKLIFEKWSDGDNKYLKVEYVYQTSSQIRNAVKLSIDEPPKKVLLEFSDCEVDENGLCPWSDFMNLFRNKL